MKRTWQFVLGSLISGLLVVVPVYLAILLLIKATGSILGLVKPFAKLLPAWLPAERLLSVLLVLFVVFLIGAGVRTKAGEAARTKAEQALFGKIPGYDVIRGLTVQVAGESRERTWKPALAEIEEALVPAFIIEEFPDGRFTIFVPSVPTPFAGAVYVLPPERVHPLDVPFTQAVRAVSRWGSGSRELVASLEKRGAPAG